MAEFVRKKLFVAGSVAGAIGLVCLIEGPGTYGTHPDKAARCRVPNLHH